MAQRPDRVERVDVQVAEHLLAGDTLGDRGVSYTVTVIYQGRSAARAEGLAAFGRELADTHDYRIPPSDAPDYHSGDSADP